MKLFKLRLYKNITKTKIWLMICVCLFVVCIIIGIIGSFVRTYKDYSLKTEHNQSLIGWCNFQSVRYKNPVESENLFEPRSEKEKKEMIIYLRKLDNLDEEWELIDESRNFFDIDGYFDKIIDIKRFYIKDDKGVIITRRYYDDLDFEESPILIKTIKIIYDLNSNNIIKYDVDGYIETSPLSKTKL